MGMLVSGTLLPGLSSAQGIKAIVDSLGAGTKPASSELPPAGQLDWAKAQLAAAKEDEKNQSVLETKLAEAGLPADRIEDFRAANREIQRNYQNAVGIITALMAKDGKEAEVPAFPPPTSEKEASTMRAALRRESMAENSAASEKALMLRWISQSQALQANAERETRQLQEEADTSKTPEAKTRALVQVELANLRKRAAESALFLAKWKSAQLEELEKKSSLESDALRAALRTGGFDRQLDARRAESQLAEIASESNATEKEVAGAVKEQSRAVEEAAGFHGKGDSTVAKARETAADTLAYTLQGLVSALQANAILLDDEKAHWVGVKNLADDTASGDLRGAIAKAEDAIRKQKEMGPAIERRMFEAREGLDAVQRQLQAGVSDATTKSLLERTEAAAQKRADVLGNLVSKSEQIVATQEEFLAELQTVHGRESAARKFTRAWNEISKLVSNVWQFELFNIGTNRMTTGKMLMTAMGLFLAILAAGWVSRWTSRTATRRFQMAEDQKMLLEKSIFIPVAGILVLTVLYWLNIPVTLFAFLGGALAIGVGFGAQNLVNNFISGIILLLERQIKVGDIIEVGGSTGKVTHLGSRCSRIRKFDGVELLVPNSAFLEKEVTNWTLADPHHRFDFTIGVAYGSPVEKVMGLLNSALERQPEILGDPAPGVFFEAFGDSALVFRIYYWLELGTATDARQVGSELRCRIERDFRAAEIEIPYPRRDFQLRNSSPISVRLERKDG